MTQYEKNLRAILMASPETYSLEERVNAFKKLKSLRKNR